MLDAYCRHIQTELKTNVQVRTGALMRSITVRAVIDGEQYSLAVDLNHYWRYLPEPIPMKAIFETAGQKDPDVWTRYYQGDGFRRYGGLTLGYWKKALDDAYEKDILWNLNGQKNK